LLLEEGRPMLRSILSISIVACSVLLPATDHAAPLDDLKSLNLQVPYSDQMFTGPGADVVNNNCLACHSADHVLNQPALSTKAWDEVVHKMINAYKAPIASKDIAAIVDYLAQSKRN
jgi:mono/diheme cytochrome c family protein